MSSQLKLRMPNFDKLEKKVLDASRKREALDAMLKILEGSDIFDQQDKRAVEETLASVLSVEKQARVDLEGRVQIYQSTLQAVQQQIIQRHLAMSNLNDSTEAFDLFPELAVKFAQRQADMITLVEQATRKLEE
jgi:hypothetical protein